MFVCVAYSSPTDNNSLFHYIYSHMEQWIIIHHNSLFLICGKFAHLWPAGWLLARQQPANANTLKNLLPICGFDRIGKLPKSDICNCYIPSPRIGHDKLTSKLSCSSSFQVSGTTFRKLFVCTLPPRASSTIPWWSHVGKFIPLLVISNRGHRKAMYCPTDNTLLYLQSRHSSTSLAFEWKSDGNKSEQAE